MTLEIAQKRTYPKLNTYLGLCTEVYDLSKPTAPQEAYAFYRAYASKANGPILEPMCGTGRFLLPLLAEGFDIYGFDASDPMLNTLHIKAIALNLASQCQTRVWKGFVETLKRPERYNLIFIPSGSFCLITDLKAAKDVLKTLYDHLSDDGILLFEGETHKAVPPLETSHTSTYSRSDGKTITLTRFTTLEKNVYTSLCTYELIEENNIIHKEIESLKVRIYALEELTILLQDIGFRHIRTLKAFDKNATPAEDDESIIYECRK